MKKLVALLLALGMVLTALPIMAEEIGAGVLDVQFDGAVCQIPASVQIVYKDGMYCDFEYKGGMVSVSCYAWPDEWLEKFQNEVASSDWEYQNLVMAYALMQSGQDQGMAVNVGRNAIAKDIGMPNGEPVWSGEMVLADGIVIYAQTYCDVTIMIAVSTYGTFTHGEAEELAAGILCTVEVANAPVADAADAEDEEAPAAAEETASVEEASSAVAYVVITADSGKIRTEASISGGLIKTAYKGETFELIEQSGDWYVVRVNGRTGYIHKGVAAIQ